MHITFQRLGGLSPLLMNRVPPLSVDLDPNEEQEVRKLLDSSFFQLQSSPPPTRGGDQFRYAIGVDDSGASKQVILAEQDIPQSLRPFLEWLERKAGLRKS